MVSAASKKIFAKLGYSEVKEVDRTNDVDKQVNLRLLDVSFTNHLPFGIIKNYQEKTFGVPLIVYFLFDTKNEKLYVGSSINGGDRMAKYDQFLNTPDSEKKNNKFQETLKLNYQ